MVTRREGRGGFTLPEAIIALTISSVLVLLVGTIFLVQNDFYSHVFLRSQVQENARAAIEVISSEVRSVTPGGFVVADSSRMVFYSPMVIAVVCGAHGGEVIAHVPGGVAAIDSTEVGGFGYRNASGLWSFYARTWAQLQGSGGNPAQECFNRGADTTGISSEFVKVATVVSGTGIGTAGLFGATIMIFRKTEFRFDDSDLIAGDRALYWGLSGQSLKELVTGMSEDAHFEFQTGSGSWVKVVTGGTLSNIIGVRVAAQSIGRGQTSTQLNYDFGYTVDIRLPNT